MTNLELGRQYYIRVTATNECGESPPTSDLILVVGTCPDPPSQVTTVNNLDNRIYCEWFAPNANGFPITGYKVSILANNNAIFSNTQA